MLLSVWALDSGGPARRESGRIRKTKIHCPGPHQDASPSEKLNFHLQDPHQIPCVATILARSDSRRLPGKVLTDLGNGLNLLDLVTRRLANCTELDHIALATTERSIDDSLCAHARDRLHLPVHRGATDDVASRALSCARAFGAALFVRVNADSPFVDPELIDAGVRLARSSKADLTTNLVPRSYPYGIAVEVIRVDCFSQILPGFRAADREHVTQFFYRNPDQFHIQSLPACPIPGLATVRLTVDDPPDLETMRRVVNHLGHRALTADYARVAEIV